MEVRGMRNFLICRTLDHSTIVYESPDARPLLRVEWNPLDANYLSTFAVDSSKTIVMDIRMPSVPAAELEGQNGPVVTMRWSPASSSNLMTSDEQTVRLWDLSDYDRSSSCKWQFDIADIAKAEASVNSMIEPTPVQQILWPTPSPDWIGLATSGQISVFRL